MLQSAQLNMLQTTNDIRGHYDPVYPDHSFCVCVCVCDLLSAANLQEKLTDFLPKLLDCSTEIKSFQDPPKLPSYTTLELCERFSRIMAALGRVPTEGR